MSVGKQYVGKNSVGTFEAKFGSIPVCELGNGIKLEVPTITIDGSGDGPTFGMIAAIHGGEHIGVEVVRRVMTTLKPGDFKGKVTAVPVANQLAFEAMTRDTPLDAANLNRVFPGSTNKSFTDLLAYRLMNDFVKDCDYLLDIHSGSIFGEANYVLLRDRKETGLAFGADNIFVGASPGGGIRDQAEALGVHCMTTELGGINCGGPDEKWVERTVTGVFNLMKHFGMMDGELELPAEQKVFTRKTILRPMNGGLYFLTDDAKVNNIVPKGTVLANIVNPVTFEIVEQLTAPYDNSLNLLQRNVNCGVTPGDHCFFIGDYDTAEIVKN